MQARVHAYRRPSTASGRLSSQAATTYHRPAPPNKLAPGRSEYRGAGSHSNNAHSNSDVSRGGYQGQQRFSRGLRVRERPLSAGCHPVSSLSSRVPTSIAAGGTTTAVETCTRSRAGIVRGGGRDGRAAPPPTPPPPRSPSSPRVAPSPPASQQKQGQQPLCAPPDSMRRRRPSTAGAKRSPAAAAAESYEYCRRFDAAPGRGASAEDVDAPADDGAMSQGFTGAGCSSGGNFDSEERRLVAGDTVAGQIHSFPSRVDPDGDVGQVACPAGETAEATHPPSHAQSPSLGRSVVYTGSSRDERGRTTDVTGYRRRPASAAPPRSRATNTYDRFHISAKGGSSSSSGGTESDFGRVPAVEPSRGRLSARAGGRAVHRPRSASATTGRRAPAYDVGASTPAAAGGIRSSTSVARPRAQSASSTTAAVVPSFVVLEKQVLRFFGHLTEGETFRTPRPR